MQRTINKFLKLDNFAVVGASTDRNKFGNKVLRCYKQHKMPVVAVNPKNDSIEGVPCVASLGKIDKAKVARTGVSIVTPPPVSLRIVEAAASEGFRYLWLQPGSEDEQVIRRIEELNLTGIYGGPCLLATLGFPDDG